MRLPRGVMLLPAKENAPAEAPNVFYSEIIGGHIGYVRVGSLNAANLQALDKSLSQFRREKRERSSLWTFAPVRQRLICRWPPNSQSGFVPKAKRFLPCANRRDIKTACSVRIVIRHFAAWSWYSPMAIRLVRLRRSLRH